MKRKIIALFLISLIFTGCKKSDVDEEAVISQMDMSNNDDISDMSHYRDDYGYIVVPNYYVQDYSDIKISDTNTIGTAGELITCLAMINSYWNNDESSPDSFYEKYQDKFDDNGFCNIESMSDLIMNNNDATWSKEEFNPDKVLDYISKYQATVLVEIPHSSMFGKNTSYLIITGISGEYVAVRDPNLANIQNYAIKDMKTSFNEYLYHFSDILVSVGEDSTMYVYRWGD